jgi:hypothetical protein
MLLSLIAHLEDQAYRPVYRLANLDLEVDIEAGEEEEQVPELDRAIFE